MSYSYDSRLCVSGFLCVIALMGDKSSAMYKDLFFVLDQHATRLQQSFCPTRITSDFESGLVKVIAEEVSVFFRVFFAISIMPFSFLMLIIVGVGFTSTR